MEERELINLWLKARAKRKELEKELERIKKDYDALKDKIIQQVFHGLEGEIRINEFKTEDLGVVNCILYHKRIRATRLNTEEFKKTLPNVYHGLLIPYEYSIIDVKFDTTFGDEKNGAEKGKE